MFFKKYKLKLLLLFISFFIIPQSIIAYSDYIIASGENIGIRLNANGILIVGTYEVDGTDIAKDAGLKIGDTIIAINNNDVKTISEMVNQINESRNDNIEIKYIRDNKENTTTLNIKSVNGINKTGLYVKDSISGIGTLTFIDPKTELFGALGHEIIDSSTREILDISSGVIFDSKVTGITPSSDGNPGEKNATFETNSVDGTIEKNTNKGIFGSYTNKINSDKLYKVATINDIKLGKAKILTVLDGEKVSEYSINILKVSNTKDNIKNLIFEIDDENLLRKTNGIIQGMSGSPIIQDDYIIGAVTHVVVDNPHKGYGILITNMLEEAEK